MDEVELKKPAACLFLRASSGQWWYIHGLECAINTTEAPFVPRVCFSSKAVHAAVALVRRKEVTIINYFIDFLIAIYAIIIGQTSHFIYLFIVYKMSLK